MRKVLSVRALKNTLVSKPVCNKLAAATVTATISQNSVKQSSRSFASAIGLEKKNINKTVYSAPKVQQTQKRFSVNSTRRVVLLTTNKNKLPEYERNFDLYGVMVTIESPNPPQGMDVKEYYLSLLKKPNVICLLKDDTFLFKHGTQEKASVEHLELVDNVNHLKVYSLEKKEGVTEPTVDQIVEKHYSHLTEGFIDMNKKLPRLLHVFGWDDIFVVKHTGLTYYELAKRGTKISSRDMVISDYIKDRLHYKNTKDLKFNPMKQDAPIDFSRSATEFINNNEFFSNEYAKRFGLFDMFQAVLNGGVMFKASKNRRQNNYFSTLVNPAIPLVPKRDKIHEITFMAHDIGHFYILELIYTGYEDTELQRMIYLCYRMMSEAMTMVIADMMFIDSLNRSGVQYDFTARKIYPVLKATGLDFERDGILPTLKKLCKANVAYCCKGDDSLWRELVGPQNLDVLDRFKEKFGPFFIEDYKWGIQNYQNMTTRAKQLRRWWDSVKVFKPMISADLPMWTIDEFIDKLTVNMSQEKISNFSNDQIVDTVFEVVWENVIARAFTTKVTPLPEDRKRYNCFVRYMMGQFAIFGAHENVAEAEMYKKALTEFIQQKSATKTLTANEAHNAMKFYGAYVDSLLSKNLISSDDAATFKDIYPLFEPCYVFYDEQSDYYPELSDVYKKAFNLTK